MSEQIVNKRHLRNWALQLGIELVGVTRSENLASALRASVDKENFQSFIQGEVTSIQITEGADGPILPEEISERLHTVVVVGKRLHAGIAMSEDRGLRRLAAGNIANRLDHAAARLGYEIERHEQLAVLIPALNIEWDREDATNNTPAGQGSLWARTAAVVAGLGTWGLNDMVLTPQFGPRVYFSTLLTDLELQADPPLEHELCLGLHECGKCAQVCPANAIPTQAPEGASLHSYRGLNKRACAKCSQPYGPDAFVEFFRDIFRATGKEQDRLIASPTAHEIWQNMTITKFGAFTGCIDCLTVCPVGEDFDKVSGEHGR